MAWKRSSVRSRPGPPTLSKNSPGGPAIVAGDTANPRSQKLIGDVAQTGLKRLSVRIVYRKMRWRPSYASLRMQCGIVQPGHVVHRLMGRELRVPHHCKLTQGLTILIRWKHVELRARLLRPRAGNATVHSFDRWTGHIRGHVRTGD